MFAVVIKNKDAIEVTVDLYTGQKLDPKLNPLIVMVTASGQELNTIYEVLPAFVPKGKRVMTWHGDIAKLVYEAFI